MIKGSKKNAANATANLPNKDKILSSQNRAAAQWSLTDNAEVITI